jgi:predicted phage terminase large subunit-like protein
MSNNKNNKNNKDKQKATNSAKQKINDNIIQPSKKRIKNAVLRRSFPSFVHTCFNTLNPAIAYIPNWHIDYICYHLEQVQKGNINRLIINMPPRALKSITVSVAWPAWLLGWDPRRRIIAASHSNMLSFKHSQDCRTIMQSEWFRSIFPNAGLSKTQNRKDKFCTTKQGFRFATSVGGALTGEGGDVLIIDDPHNQQHVNKASYRQKVLEWYDQTIPTRLNDKNKGAIILVMQRVHEEDLTAHLLNKSGANNWTVLNLPAIFMDKTDISFYGRSFRIKENELLQPEKEDHKTLKQIESEMGEANFTAQYLQRPYPKSGNMVRKNDIIYFKYSPESFNSIIQSWDTAIKTGINSDYTVGTTWGICQDKFYLLRLTRLRLEYSNLKYTVKNEAQKWKASRVLIEDKASGQSLIQDLKLEGNLVVKPIKTKDDKITRFARVVPYFENHQVLVHNNLRWRNSFINEITNFPNTSHDDIVDSVSQFLNFVKYEMGYSRFRVRNL